MKKLTMLYDATVVCNILTKNSSRSGIFFVAYNVLLELLKREEFNIFLYGDNIVKLQNVIENYDEFVKCKRYRFSFLDDIIIFLSDLKKKNKKKLFYIFLSMFLSLFISVLKKINKFYINNFKKLDDIDVYFSPMKAVPKFIFKFKSIKRFTILHDTIPLVNDYRNNAEKHDWYHKLISTINSADNYFANSLCTKQDFIEYVPKINPSNICVIPLSTGKPYFKIGDEYYINQIKRKYSIPTDKKYIFSLCNLDPRKNLIFAIKNFFNFVEKHNLDNFIFLAPEAASCEEVNTSFWLELAEKLKEQWFDVFFNIVDKKSNIKGKSIKKTNLTFAEAFALARMSRGIVSLRSGLSEVLLQTNLPMCILYTNFRNRKLYGDMPVELVMSGFGINKLPSINLEKTFELSVPYLNDADLAQSVMNCLKGASW